MKQSVPQKFFTLFTVGAIFFVNARTAGVAQTRSAPVVVQSNRAGDPFANLIAGAASFDMDSPVEARAEFDPPEVTAGANVTYRLTVSALNESLKAPDELTAPGLTLKKGGRDQIYERAGTALVRPQTTILYHGTAGSNGNYTVAAFEVVAYSKPVKVAEATLKVSGAEAAATPSLPRLVMELPPGDIYVGQTLRIPLVLPVPAEGSIISVSQARVTGEFVFSETAPVAIRQENIRRDNKSFLAFVQEVMITPLREGEQEVVAQGYCNMVRAVPGQSNAFTTTMVLVDSAPTMLNAKATPLEGRLPGFAGAIGSFQIDAPRISTTNVLAGEPVVLTVTIRGDGNVGRLTPPPPPLLRDWQVFPPIGENLPAAIIQTRGVAIFTYTLIPLNDQSKATPPIPFCYFDPKKKAYVDLTVPPVHLTVKPSAAGAAALAQATAQGIPAAGGEPAAEKELVLSGLTENPGGVVTRLTPVQQQWWFLGLQLVPAAALGGLCAWDRRRRYLELHPEVILKRRARQGLRRELRLARHAAARQDAAGFVSGATNALREACAPTGSANPSALVCADVLREIPASERENGNGELVRRLFAAADALRFGGTPKDSNELISMRPQLERLLGRLKEKL